MRGLQTLISLRSFVSKDPIDILKFPSICWLPCLSDSLTQLQLRGVKKQANEIRSGTVLDIDGRLMQVLKYQHTQGAGRQLGNVQFELRDLLTKAKHPLKHRPYDMVEVVRLEERNFQCLYQEGSLVHCMDPDTFEQVTLDVEVFGEQAQFLSEGLEVTLHFHEGAPVTGEVPANVTLRVKEAAPTMKGETAAPSYKPAVLENGVRVMVPPFVQQGDQVVVDTVEGKFVKRA